MADLLVRLYHWDKLLPYRERYGNLSEIDTLFNNNLKMSSLTFPDSAMTLGCDIRNMTNPYT